MLPSLIYSQYPKQTIINGDSVVIMTAKQAVKMNQVFISKNQIIDIKTDSIKLLTNSVDSLISRPPIKMVKPSNFGDIVGLIVFIMTGVVIIFMTN